MQWWDIVILSIVGIILCFWLISAILFIFPIHKVKQRFQIKARKTAGVWVIAHRGGSNENLESNLSTYSKALQNGADIVEMDVQFTKDSQVVVCHDTNLKRLCGVDAELSSFNYKDLPEYLPEVALHFADYKYQTQSDDDRKIPLFSDLCKNFPDAPFNIELKSKNRKLKEECARILLKHNRNKFSIIGRAEKRDADDMRLIMPETASITPSKVASNIFILLIMGLLPFYPIPYDTFQFPLVNDDYVRYKRQYGNGNTFKGKFTIAMLKVYNALACVIFWHLRKRGILVFLYTLNGEEDWERALTMGVDGVITDCPGKLRRYLNRKEGKEETEGA